MKKVLITGGAGLVGSHIADQLVKQGVLEIVILDNFVRGTKANLQWALANGNVKIIKGDIRDQTLLNEIMSGVDVLFHQAAIRITQCAEEPRLALEVLVDGTYNVLEAAVKAKVKKVIAASSASVLGMAEEFPTTESHHPYNNRTFYGAAKTFNEGMLRTFNEMYSLDYIALRYFNVYGVRMDIYGVYTEVLVRWMDRIIEGKPPLIFGDGLQTMDFVSVEDIAKANILAAQSNVTDEVFNIASGVETSLNDLAFSLLKVMKSDLKPEYTAERKVNPVQKRLADTSKAEKLLGFKAEVSLEEGLSRLVDWWKTTKNIV
ncbi:NAD-dependent epimerase [Anabaena sp. WA102]|uniref:SDR family NAD(P)-dependent oxidoreductase n=1 Tax=Anabaena sp. WA102 TaxID=1647413 RepID=UPI0006AC0656|nr:SDR family NAD(P)-dependent oxidoreductase [Anabaena sp. WA102]ALB40469.1 NAD-dependent epimerase [Anabaena sp. WA102]